MNKKMFSIPYNNDFKGTTYLIKKYKNEIDEVYFAPNPQIIGSGRGEKSNEYYDEYIKELIKEAHRNNVKANMVINPIGYSEKYADKNEMNKIIDYVSMYSNIYSLDYVTLTNPILAKALSKSVRDTKLVASVNMFISNYESVRKAKQLGLSEIYIDRDRNRDLKFIKNIKESFPEMKIRIMLNEGCLPNCLFRISHFDCLAILKDDEEIGKYNNQHFELGCHESYNADKSLFLKTPIIRPEELKYYDGIADKFKLVGRTTSTRINEMRLRAYIERSYDGDFGIFSDNPSFRKVMTEQKISIQNKKISDEFAASRFDCTKDCNVCQRCKTEFDNAVEYKKNREIIV